MALAATAPLLPGTPPPSLPHALPLLCAATWTRPWVPRKPGGALGVPGGSPCPSRLAAVQREAGGEEARRCCCSRSAPAGTALHTPPCAVPSRAFPSRASARLNLLLGGGFPTPLPGPRRFIPGPARPRQAQSLPLPLPFPFRVPSYLLIPRSPRTGAEGRAVEVRGRRRWGGDWVCPGTEGPARGIEERICVGSRAGGSKDLGCIGVGEGCRGASPC